MEQPQCQGGNSSPGGWAPGLTQLRQPGRLPTRSQGHQGRGHSRKTLEGRRASGHQPLQSSLLSGPVQAVSPLLSAHSAPRAPDPHPPPHQLQPHGRGRGYYVTTYPPQFTPLCDHPPYPSLPQDVRTRPVQRAKSPQAPKTCTAPAPKRLTTAPARAPGHMSPTVLPHGYDYLKLPSDRSHKDLGGEQKRERCSHHTGAAGGAAKCPPGHRARLDLSNQHQHCNVWVSKQLVDNISCLRDNGTEPHRVKARAVQ